MSNDARINGWTADGFESVGASFAKLIGPGRPGGGALTISVHGESVVNLWTGYADAARTTPWTENTGAVAWSATKGPTAMVIHRLVDRGLLDYDEPVARYWPEFAQQGKGTITVRDALTHRAGLSSVVGLTTRPADFLDLELMESRIAAARPRLHGVPAYHGLTYGWVLGGLARSVTGSSLPDLFRTELAEPLGVDGLHLGAPAAGSKTVIAEMVGKRFGSLGSRVALSVASVAGRAPYVGLVPNAFGDVLGPLTKGDPPLVIGANLGAASGIFTAPALANFYAAIVGGTLLSPELNAQIGVLQSRQRDRILGQLWGLGFHHLPGMRGFGHVGLSGTTGWVVPQHGLAIGFVHNRMDLRTLPADQVLLPRLMPSIAKAVRASRPARAGERRAS